MLINNALAHCNISQSLTPAVHGNRAIGALMVSGLPSIVSK